MADSLTFKVERDPRFGSSVKFMYVIRRGNAIISAVGNFDKTTDAADAARKVLARRG